MRRFQLFEFGDQAWFSGEFREAYFDCLNFYNRLWDPYAGILPAFQEFAQSAGQDEVLDLASGGGHHLNTFLRTSATQPGTLPKLILSDLHPQIEHYQNLERKYGKNAVGYIEFPVSAFDAAEISKAPNIRSIFNALHHFKPSEAAKLIYATLESADGIFVAEPLARNYSNLLMMFLGPLIGPFAPFFSPHFTVKKFFFTSIIPLIPFLVLWDGIVSVLRNYSADEIIQFIPQEQRGRLTVRSGSVRYGTVLTATYVWLLKQDEPVQKSSLPTQH